ncbi:2OG-Fe(II) oxygenase family protein [Porphyrobacter sp. AAP82]|uniref:2OG-Fe(II) oxygenase family protein n=1 Tax=Porphyrobacter sp. AAP82 TaxID=1248917 RepID=UPI0002E2CFED|nr:tetratricopeptide repeat protein [Porphyrobacter sp. AAP82]
MTTGASVLSSIHARLQSGDVAGAARAIADVVRAEPANGAAWQLAGIIRRRAKDAAGAVEAFGRALAAGVRSAEVYNSLALSLEDLGRAEEAAAAYEQAFACDPAYLPARINAARLAAAQGDLAGAEAALRAVLAEQPGAVTVSNALGALYAEAGEPGKAAAQYRQSIAAVPGNLAATIRLGLALREDGRAEEALAHFRALAGRFPRAPEFADAMAGALIECGHVAEAEALLERTVEQSPDYFPAHRGLARLAHEYGTGKDPYRSYRALAERWPGEAAIWHSWTGLMLDRRDYAGVLGAVAGARRALGGLPELDLYEAIARSEQGEGTAAEALFARAAPRLGGTVLVPRARNALRRGEPAQAEALAAEATRADPADRFAWAYRGLAWRLLDDPREFWLHDYDRHVEQRAVAYLSDPGALDELRETLRGLHRAQAHPSEQSLRGGTQTEGNLFNRSDPVLRRLREAIREQVAAYLARFDGAADHPCAGYAGARFGFEGSWSVRLMGEGFHIAHIHPAGAISSALHVSVPPLGAEDGRDAGALVLGEPPAELGLGLGPRRVVTPIEGALVLFPSSMWHGTKPFRLHAERMTVAFDVAVRR